MSYERFLTNNDYLISVNKDHLKQISNNLDETKFIRAEENAEICVMEYMVENYQIEDVFTVGKAIREYSPYITYPAGAHITFSGEIVKMLLPVQGISLPEDKAYWVEDTVDVVPEEYSAYTQTTEFFAGDRVVYKEKYYSCLEANGFEFNNIRIPGAAAMWLKLDPLTLTDPEKAVIYEFDIDSGEYVTGDKVVYNGEYYQATADYAARQSPEMNVNIKVSDNRNKNIRKHMVRLATYELIKSVTPNNVSASILLDYEESLKWLKMVNAGKINPMVERKAGGGDGNGVSVDWAISSFSNGGVVNEWQI